MFNMDDDRKGVIFGWQTKVCLSPTFRWDKRENVWSKLCFIFIRLEEDDVMSKLLVMISRIQWTEAKQYVGVSG